MYNPLEIRKNKDSATETADRPSFLTFISTSRKHNLYRGKEKDTYYTPIRDSVLYKIVMVLNIITIVSIQLPRLIDYDNWNYGFDLFFLGIILITILLYVDYKTTKFRKVDESSFDYEEDVRKANRSVKISKIAMVILPLLIIFGILNSFSFCWLRSQFDNSEDADFTTVIIEKEFVNFGDTNTQTIPVIINKNGAFYAWINIRNESQPVEFTVNGVTYYERDGQKIRKRNDFGWEKSYFRQRIIFELNVELKNKNIIEIKCGDINKEYVINIETIITN